MGLILRQIIKYLQKDKVDIDKKEKLISKLKTYLIYEIKEMSSTDILNCLLTNEDRFLAYSWTPFDYIICKDTTYA